MGIRGHKAHSARLKRLSGPEMRRSAGKVIEVAASLMQTDARRSITAGAVSGKGHIASAPGQPPQNDTGHLVSQIRVDKTGDLTANVESTAVYAAALELGTSKMSPRPYMRPAAKRIRPKAQKLMAEAVNRIVKGQPI